MADPFRQDFGASLREARERAGITLRDISTRTKISLLTLEALERNDLPRLPGGVFTRSFVRSYAREVGLDPEDTLNRFLAQFPDAAGDAELHEPSDEGLEREPKTGGARALRVLAWLLPILAGVAYFGFLRSGVEFTGVTRSGTEVARPAVPAPPPAQAVTPAPGPQAPEGGSQGTAPAVQPAVMAPESASSAGGAPAAVAPAAVAPAPVATVPLAPAPVADGALRVVLAPTGPCWLSLRAGGETVFTGLMQAGERREFDLRGAVTLTAGDAGALGLLINGEAARPLGEPGKVVTVRFSPDSFRELLAQR